MSEAVTNDCAEPLPLGVPHVPLDCAVEPEKLQPTEPIGTGMEPAVLDCHIRYMVAAKLRLTFVLVDGRGTIGASSTACPVLPSYG
jgi:hypothetical protein